MTLYYNLDTWMIRRTEFSVCDLDEQLSNLRRQFEIYLNSRVIHPAAPTGEFFKYQASATFQGKSSPTDGPSLRDYVGTLRVNLKSLSSEIDRVLMLTKTDYAD